jgi:GNAT superfamily N-acetyltransferase
LEAINAIERGEMKGYLAYADSECVGWLNANESHAYARLWDDLKDVVGDLRVGVTICYLIRADHRNRGVARILLRAALDGFRAQGFDAALALPMDVSCAPALKYRGTLSMYRELQYQELARHDNLVPMWLPLRADADGVQS